MGDGADNGWPQDAHRELWAVQLLQKALAHVFGQRVAVWQAHLPEQLLRLHSAAHNNNVQQCNIASYQ